MTEEYLEYVKDFYDNWREKEIERVVKHNLDVNNKVILYNKIHSLLKDEKVREFADLIKYVEGDKPTNFEKNDVSLAKFLRIERFDISGMTLKEYLKIDKNPIFCFVKSTEPKYGVVSRKKFSAYDDIYFSLEFKGHGFVISDLSPYGNNRNKFKDKYDIIYAPEGKYFSDDDTFYTIQAEYVEEAIKTDQNQAKKLILSKYGRKFQ